MSWTEEDWVDEEATAHPGCGEWDGCAPGYQLRCPAHGSGPNVSPDLKKQGSWCVAAG